MDSRQTFFAACALAVLAAGAASAQQAQPQFPDMSFFVTSKSGPDGANFGGLEGADKYCQTLATAAGAGAKTWHAYLSTQATATTPAVNARDRIGTGPWTNVKGVVIASSVDELHTANKLNIETSLVENGRMVPGRAFVGNQHDILTGSMPDGRAFPPGEDKTCGNWTKDAEGSAIVGHSDRLGLADTEPMRSWNSSHPTRGCSASLLIPTGGAGLLYCFAVK
jgi:hypothetical protein